MAHEESPSNDFRKLRVKTHSPTRPPPSPFAAIAHDESVDTSSQETLKPVHKTEDLPPDAVGEPVLPVSYGSTGSSVVTSNSEFSTSSTATRGVICFNDTVKLDDGRLHTLHEPLSKRKDRSRSRGRSIMQELAQEHTKFGEAVKVAGHVGELRDKGLGSEGPPSHRNANNPANGNRLLQTTVDQLPDDDEELKECDKVASLTSDSSISPSVDEVNTPVDTLPEMDSLPSPVATASPASYTAEDTSGPVPMPMPARPTRRRTNSGYSKSSMTDVFRPGSLRRNSRHHSRRSTSTSTSKSPATAFLSQWGKGREDSATSFEPDDEGQEIGDHSKYIIGHKIGEGGFSSVKEVVTMEGDERIRRAVKIVRKRVLGASESENEKMQAKFEHEVSVWRYLRHRHILSLRAVYDTPFATFCITRLNQGGTLFDLVRSTRKAAGRKGLSPYLATRYAAQLASALRYLHEDVHMVHRDVKLENCLVDLSRPDARGARGGNLQLCDFGMADFITDESTISEIAGAVQAHERGAHNDVGEDPSKSAAASVVLGSLEYASPEGLASRGIPMFVTTGDVWAFGVIAYALLVGDLPFRHELQPKLQSKILEGEWDVQALRNASTVKEMGDGTGKAEEVVRGCLTVSTSERWRITDVVSSRWLLEYEDSGEETDRSWDQ